MTSARHARTPRRRSWRSPLVHTLFLRHDELGDRRAGGISRQASDGFSGGETQTPPARAADSVADTFGDFARGVNQMAGNLENKFHRRGWPFLFLPEVISPWPSPFPCLIPIAWNVAAANRSKGNFPSSRRTGVNVALWAHPQADDAMRRGLGQVAGRQLEIHR